MSVVDNIKSDITDELRILFSRVTRSEDIDEEGKFTLKYYGHDDIYDGSRHSGMVVIGVTESKELQYAYRLRFEERDNRPRRTYWYYESTGWSEEQHLIAEKEHIVSTLQWISNRTNNADLIDDREVERIENMFSELETNLENIRSTYSISDVVGAVENENVEELQNRIAPDESSAVEFWKLIYSKKNDELEFNDVSVEYEDSSIALFTSERTFYDMDDSRTYPFALVVRREEASDKKFFVHRIEIGELVEDASTDWNRNKVRNLLGYEVSWRDDNIESIDDKRTKLGGNVRVVPQDYDREKHEYRDYIEGEVVKRIVKIYRDYYNEEKGIDLDSASSVCYGIFGISTDDNATTDNLRQVQNELGISESTVRERQDKRNIGRLSSNLRGDIIENIYRKQVQQWVYGKTGSELKKFVLENSKAQGSRFRNTRLRKIHSGSKVSELGDILLDNPDEITKKQINGIIDYFVTEDFEKVSSGVHDTIGENAIDIENATEHPSDYRQQDYKIEKKIVVPEQTNLVFRLNGGKASDIHMEKGVYEFRKVTEMDTSVF